MRVVRVGHEANHWPIAQDADKLSPVRTSAAQSKQQSSNIERYTEPMKAQYSNT
jgi:hypothetical protein